MDDLLEVHECCSRCGRVPLVGEQIYVVEEPVVMCELCRALEADPPLQSRLVHGPAFERMIRIIDRRGLDQRAT